MIARSVLHLAVGAIIILMACPIAATADDGPIALSATRTPGQYVLRHWPERGWIVQQFSNHVEVRFPGLDRPVMLDPALPTGAKVGDLQVAREDGDLFVRFTLTCDCTVAVSGDGGRLVSFTVMDRSPRRTGRQALAVGPVPDWAPVPVPKKSGRPMDRDAPIDVEEARERLMEQLLRAADAGIIELEPEGAEMEAPETTDGESAARASVERAAPGAPEPREADGPEPVAIRDRPADRPGPRMDDAAAPRLASGDDAAAVPEATDERTPDAAPALAAKEPIVRCVAPEDLQFPHLVDVRSLWTEISQLRARLVGEFDRVDRQAALDLTKVYLALDLVPEARAILQDFLADDPRQRAFAEIASILAGERLSDGAVLRKPGCSEDQELWRAQALALDTRDEDALAAAEAAGRAFERLPQGLRERAAASIGLAATRAGEWAKARELEALANRSAGALDRRSQPLLLLSAALAKWHGDAARNRDLLRRVLAGGGPLADRAMIALAQMALQDEAYLTAGFETLRRDVGALAQRARGTPLGAEAFTLEVRMRARSGPREVALGLVEFGVAQGLLPPEDRPALLAELVGGELYDDLERPLAMSYLDDPDRFAPAMTEPGFRQALVRSMIDLGVPTLAPPLLQTSDRGDGRLMADLAAALLDAGEPELSMEYAANVPDPALRARLRGEARLAMGKAAPDAPVYDDLPISEEEKSAYRLAGVDRRYRDAMARGDVETAIDAAELKMALAPSTAAADQLAMTALEAGREKVPAAVQTYLEKEDPGRLQALAGLFGATTDPMIVTDQAEAEALIEEIDAEITMIEEMLGDG